MQKTKLIATFILVFITIATFSQRPKVEIVGTEVIKLKSAINNKDYILDVYLPVSYNDSSKRFPVLYVLDGQWSFPYVGGVQGVPEDLFYDGLAPEMIVVGIKWTGDYDANRQIDMTPTQTNEFPKSGGGIKFMSVIKNEIITKINSSYHTDKVNNTLSGGSLGSRFTLYAMFQKPQLFNRYIAWGFSSTEEIFNMEKLFSENNHELNAKLFLCTNEFEEAISDTSDFTKFITQLKSHNYTGLELDTMVIQKMGHVSEGPYAVGCGLAFVFRQQDIALDESLLKQYAGHYKHDDEIINIVSLDSHVYISFPGGKVRLYAKTADTFYAKGLGGGGIGEFVKDGTGKVTNYNLILDNATITYKKID